MRILLFALFSACAGQAIASTGVSAAAALNMFIAEYSAGEISWQRDIEIEDGNIEKVSANIRPPRKIAVSSVCGIYSYRPVTWAELDSEGKKSVLNDPRLLSWIEWYGKSRLPNVSEGIAGRIPELKLGLKGKLESGVDIPHRIPFGGGK